MKLEIKLIQARLPRRLSQRGLRSTRGDWGRPPQTADGTVGHGEAAPLEGYDAASLDDALAALEDCRDPLSQSDGEDRTALLNECARRAVLPHATAAIDLALWDLEGRRAASPCGDARRENRPEVEVNATIAAPDRAGAAAEAATAREAGFRASS